MTTERTLRLFTSSAVETLFFEVRDADQPWQVDAAIEELAAKPDNILALDWHLRGDAPDLRGHDGENAVKIHQYLGAMTPVESADNRLWTYLSAVDFRDYTRKRWPLKSKESFKSRAHSRWLMRQASLNAISRNAISRLWFAADRLHDPEMVRPLSSKLEDPYAYVRFLFEKQDRHQQIFERSSLFHRELAFVVLDHLSGDFRRSTGAYVKDLMKEVLAATGYRELPVLSYEELVRLVDGIGRALSRQ